MEHTTTKLNGEPIPRIYARVNEAGLIVEAAIGEGDWQTIESRGFGANEQPCYTVDNYFKALDDRGINYFRVRKA